MNEKIEVPVTNEFENWMNSTMATVGCNFLDWIQTGAPQLLPNSQEIYFRCPTCRQSKYVYEQFNIFRNFPTCVNCAVKSLNEHR